MTRHPRASAPEKPERDSTNPEYKTYLRSTQWKVKRKRIILERGAKCEICGWLGQLSLHHLTYVRLYDELDSDLLVTCDSCHAALHGRWGAVRGIGATRHEARQRELLAEWKAKARHAMPPQKFTPTAMESSEWNGYDPFADAAAPLAWHVPRPTPSLKDRCNAPDRPPQRTA